MVWRSPVEGIARGRIMALSKRKGERRQALLRMAHVSTLPNDVEHEHFNGKDATRGRRSIGARALGQDVLEVVEVPKCRVMPSAAPHELSEVEQRASAATKGRIDPRREIGHRARMQPRRRNGSHV